MIVTAHAGHPRTALPHLVVWRVGGGLFISHRPGTDTYNKIHFGSFLQRHLEKEFGRGETITLTFELDPTNV